VWAGLERAGVDPDQETRKNRLIMGSGHDYLDQGRFNTDKMLAFLQRTYDSTLEDGFTALRAAGDVSWEVGPRRDFKDIVYYETLLDVFFLGKRMVGMCQYPKEKCPPEALAGILNTHRIAAVDSEICSNFHYVPPELLLEKDDKVRHEKRVEWMTSQLVRARRAEEEVLRANAELEQRVSERTADLQAAFRDMEAFSYSVSHDLRAPLRAIDGFARILEEDCADGLDATGREHLKKIRNSARRMGHLIEDILSLARVSRKEFAESPVDMTVLAREAAEEAGATSAIIRELPPALGDASLLRQVLLNLLSNAVKFTRDRPRPHIEVGAVPDGDRIRYSVRDNGVGFDMANAAKLFGVFQRLHGDEAFEGTGIGLAIVARIVQRHGGRVWAEARPGEGATFHFTLNPPSALKAS
jgi:signal transduction histidine kinase